MFIQNILYIFLSLLHFTVTLYISFHNYINNLLLHDVTSLHSSHVAASCCCTALNRSSSCSDTDGLKFPKAAEKSSAQRRRGVSSESTPGRGERGEGIVVVGGREFRVSVFILCFKPFCFWFTFYYEGDFPLDRWCHGVWTEGVEVSPRHVIWTAVYQQLQVQAGVQLEPGGSRIFIFT